MKIFLAVMAAAILSACANIHAPSGFTEITALDANPGSSEAVKGSYAYATLANYGTPEWILAPQYTRIAYINKTAIRHLKDGRLSKEFASTIASNTKGALDRLREARTFEGRGDVFESKIAQAKALLDSAQKLLEDGK